MPQVHPKQIAWDRYAGVLLMVSLHVVVLYGLWSYKLIPTPIETVTLFVNLINPEPPKVEEPPKPPPPKPKPRPTPPPPPEPREIVVPAPVVEPTEPVAPPPPPEPVMEEAPVVQPLVMHEELSVSCPGRSAPVYPLYSRRLGEQGRVVLRVELDEEGHITAADIESSSGSSRLDEAAVNAVKGWRCSAPRRDGIPVRAVALQPFNFRLK